MKIILSNIIIIQNPTKEITDYCRKELTYTNPQYARVRAMGYASYNIPKELKLYNIYENNLYVPYGFFEKLWKKHPIINDYIDCTTTREINITSKMTLRDYQEPSVRAIKEHCCGIFNVIVGMGKTNMSLECVARLKQKTLWITHSGDLLQQSKERAESTLNCTTSTITEGKCDLSGDIVFSTIQTLIKYIENEKIPQDLFGMTITDEVHKCSCNPKSIQMFRTCIEYFSARYRLGLTGSLWRSDGLEKCIEDIVGQSIYSIYQKKDEYLCEYNGEILMRFPSSKFSVLPSVKIIETNYNIIDKPVYDKNGGTIQYASLISNLAMDKDRNDLLIKTLNSLEGSTIILSDRVEQLKYLCEHVVNGVQIDGNTPKKIRKQALDDVRAGKIKYLFASYNLCREGLDCPILENLVMATPVKANSTVIQSIGRIMRKAPDKSSARVYDFMDNVGMLYNFFNKRRSIYRKNNWDIENIYLGGD